MSIQIPGSSTNIGAPNDARKSEKNEKASDSAAQPKADTAANESSSGLHVQEDLTTVTTINKAESKIPDERLLENSSEATEMAEKIKLAINANPYLALDAYNGANESSVNALMSKTSA